jgi:hypothetical protein
MRPATPLFCDKLNGFMPTGAGGQRLRVFLSYAREDLPRVTPFYDRLRQDGFDPWFDKANLKPGQEWRGEISNAIRSSDAVIVFLSRRSTTKEGFVQKEIRQALDVADEKPPGTVFLIPALIEQCVLPDRLSSLHAVSLSDEGAYEALIDSLSARAEQLAANKSFREQTQTSPSCPVDSLPCLLRAEGMTELISDIRFLIDKRTSNATAVSLFLNTLITNRIGRDGLTDIVLIYPGVRQTSVAAIGRLTAPNVVRFDSVTISTSDSVAVFIVKGLRVNAHAMGVAGDLTGNPVRGGVSFGDSQPMGFSAPIGYVLRGLVFSVQQEKDLSGQTVPREVFRICTLTCSEAFLGAFKTRMLMPVTSGMVWEIESIKYAGCRVQTIESSAENIIVGCADLKLYGVADSGTRFSVVFQNLPRGVRLFVSYGVTNASDRIIAQLTSDDRGPFSPPVNVEMLGNVPVVQLTITNGIALAVWEVVARDDFDLGRVEFEVFVSCDCDQRSEMMSMLNGAMVHGNFGPSGFIATADSASPVPRFAHSGWPAKLLGEGADMAS